MLRAVSEFSALEIVQLEVGLLQNFCEVIGCPETGVAALVDPAFEVDRLLAVCSERGWTVEPNAMRAYRTPPSAPVRP